MKPSPAALRPLSSLVYLPPLPLPVRSYRPQLAAAACIAPQSQTLLRRSPLRRRLATATNPRTDEEGRPMTVELKPRAIKRLREIQEKDANPNLALRITVESGGCHGFQYLMTLSDKVTPGEDTVFEEDGARVVMDEASLELLKGSKIDYTMELIGSQFKIVDNPHATSSCGCGTSFDVKF